jgi:cell division septation protein DedD
MAKNTYELNKITKKEKVDIAISIIVLLLCGWLIYFFTFKDADSEFTMINASEELIAFEAVPQLEEIVIEGDLYKAQPASKSNTREAELIDTLFYSKIVTPTESAAIVSVARDTTESTTLVSISESTLIEDAGQVLTVDSTNAAISERIESQIENKTPSTEVQSEKVAVRTKCVIILGAFRNSKNISSLLTELNSTGYDSFTVPYKGLTRVGVNVSCDDSVNAPILRTLRRAIAKDAVLMKNVPAN